MKKALCMLLALVFVAVVCGCFYATKAPKHTPTPKPTATRKATATPKPTATPKAAAHTPAPSSLRDVTEDWPKELKAIPVFDYGSYVTYGTQETSGKVDRKLEFLGVSQDDVSAYEKLLENAGLALDAPTQSQTRYKVQGTLGSGADAPTVLVNLEIATGDCEVELQYKPAAE